jgi:predicted metalloendopeptidase
MAHVQGPAYLPGWSANRELQLHVYEALDRDMQRVAKAPDADADARRLADLYAAYMDTSRIDAAGLAPIEPYLKQFDAAAGPADLVRAMAMLSAHDLDIGMGLWVHPDDQEPTRYLADFYQADLGLPDRDYYLSDEPHQTAIRDAYRGHVARLLAQSGVADSDALAQGIVDLEKRLAAAQWTEVAKRVPGATSHRVSRADLATAAPGFDLAVFADGIGIPATVERFNVGQPDFFAAYGKALSEVPLPVWRAYLRYRLLDHLARFLPAPYRTEADNFWTLTVAGATGIRPRWLRAMGMLEDAMGDALGRLYVQNHFPPEAKARATHVLDTVIAAFRHRIETSDWMSDTSKKGALAKLDKLVIRMGAPDHIRDYSSLKTSPDDAVGNWLRARALLAKLDVDKLGKTVDREEWTMSPQSVNGYYSVGRNQVVLPAALLQPPYFTAEADDAANYGGLGFFIAHELTHAFDRAGSQYDGTGKREEWMTPQDRGEFERRAKALIAQFDRYEVAPGQHLNGELTIGENIADTSGLAIALDAYRLSLAGKKAPVLDGFTGIQRFYLGFARTWASEPVKGDAGIAAALADTHAPDNWRVTGAVANQDAFYEAFPVKPGDKTFLPPAQRTRIW